MGNVQCCASGRFHEGKPPKKPSSKKKKLKGISKKTNGVSGGNGNGVQKVAAVAEDGSERAAPVAAPAQQAAPVEEVPVEETPQRNEPEGDSSDSGDSGSRGETMAAARERFFSQVRNCC